MDIKVGQKVFLKPTGNLVRRNCKIKETEITKIGNKYFYVEDEKFDIKTLKNINDDCNSAWIIYNSMQEIIDEKDVEELNRKFRQLFSWEGKYRQLTLQQLKEMAKIAELE